MNSKTIFFTLCLLNGFYSFAQPGLITCNTQTNPDRTLSIYATSHAHAEYTVKLSFTALSGFTSRSLLSSDVALASVPPGNSEIMKFTRENGAMNPAFQYKYSYYPGRALHRVPDTNFNYLMPGSAGNQLRVSLVTSMVSILSQKLKTEYRGTGFVYKLSDTICASRGGIAYECSDTTKEGEKTETVYKLGRNRVQVLHKDGTIAIYAMTAPIKLLVSPGDEVIPGQPIAVFNKESDKYRVILSICYLDEKKLLESNNSDNTAFYVYMPTRFYSGEADKSGILQFGKDYAVQHPKEIIAAEMSKREKKKYGY